MDETARPFHPYVFHIILKEGLIAAKQAGIDQFLVGSSQGLDAQFSELPA